MSILFKNAKIIVTEDGRMKTLENAYLGVEGAYIDYIGLDAPTKVYDETKDAHDKLLMPGLVNCHCHTAMNLLKGLGSDLPLDKWLGIMWPIEDKMREEEFVSGMEMAMLEMLATGTTSFSDMYMRPIITKGVVERSGMKADLSRAVMGGSADTDYKTYLNRLEALELLPFDGAYDDRLHVDWCIHAEYTIADKIAASFAEEIQSYGGRFQSHLSETKKEHEECLAKRGKTPLAWFQDLGFLNLPSYMAHCVWCSPEDLEIMKEKGVTAVHNPSSNMKLGSGFAPIPEMLEKGISVAIGTDGAASNNNYDLFEEMHLTSIIHNGKTCDPTIMKPEEILSMATVAGARAQGRFDTGSLQVGKKADIIAINLDQPHLIPDYDTLALVVYAAHGSDVTMTMVDGKILYENGIYTTLDKDRIFHDYKASCRFLT
ncbi:MAG: amidohydrolase, partial [Spirochaetales bacterium]|nr:amidohydrolase [Candidatus Physcosoma equi]